MCIDSPPEFRRIIESFIQMPMMRMKKVEQIKPSKFSILKNAFSNLFR